MKNYWVFYAIKKKNYFLLCVYKMVDIRVEKWNKAEVSVINIHENDNANKTLLKLLCTSDIKKKMER